MQKKFFYLKGHPFVFLSADGSGGKSPAEEATLAFNRLNHELKSLGGSLDDIVRTTVFTKNQECRPAVGEVRKKMLPWATRPASSAIIVHNFSPQDTVIEIDATAILSRGQKYQKKGIEFDPPRPYLKAVLADELIFLSGSGGRGDNIATQAKTIFDGIGQTLSELGSSWEKILLVSCYVKKLEWMGAVNKIFQENIGPKPLFVDLALADEFANEGMLLEVEATAYK